MKLFFFDETNILDDIKKFENIQIITFDHKSHILLKNNKSHSMPYFMTIRYIIKND